MFTISTADYTTREAKEISFTMADIKKVYKGKQNSCRCGCEGEYFSAEDGVNPKAFSMAIKHAIRANKRGESVTSIYGYIIEAELAKGKCYSIYIDESKFSTFPHGIKLK